MPFFGLKGGRMNLSCFNYSKCTLYCTIYCISVLIYEMEVIDIADADICRKMRVAYNSAFRQVKNNESVTELQHT